MVDELKAAMVDAIEEFFERNGAPPPGSLFRDAGDRSIHLAVAALLFAVARADFEIQTEERNALIRAFEQALELTAEEAQALFRLAESHRSTPLQEFTRLAGQRFSFAQKKKLVELLWRMAFSDAELQPHEEYLVRKVAGLLDLPLADFLEAKIDARDGA